MIFPRGDRPRFAGNPLAPLAVVLTLVMGGYVARLYYLQVMQFDQYTTLSKDKPLAVQQDSSRARRDSRQ